MQKSPNVTFPRGKCKVGFISLFDRVRDSENGFVVGCSFKVHDGGAVGVQIASGLMSRLF